MTNTEQADVVVIGMGPGGEEVAGRLAEAGLDVVGIDRALVGGECPYWGCVPSKMMIRAANLLAEGGRIPGMAGTATVTSDWAPVAARIRSEATDDWDDRVAVERFEGKGGRFIRGEGRVVAPGVVAVGDQRIEARRAVVLATGTQPAVPSIPGLDATPYWTNHDAIETKELPESLAVVGGGAVGAELAHVFARFGTQVTILEALERLVPVEEPEAGELLAEVFAADGIAVRAAATIERVDHDGNRFLLTMAHGGSGGAPAPGGHRPSRRPRRPRGRGDRSGREPTVGAGRRAPPGRRPRVGGRRCHREGPVHPRRHVSRGHRRGRHPG